MMRKWAFEMVKKGAAEPPDAYDRFALVGRFPSYVNNSIFPPLGIVTFPFENAVPMMIKLPSMPKAFSAKANVWHGKS
jgi:heme/copper-type cytochrome/quinol oxidase subunit 1